MLRRRRTGNDFHDRAKALMQKAVEPGADLTAIEAEAAGLRAEMSGADASGRGDADAVDEALRFLDVVNAMAHPPAAQGLEGEARAVDDAVLAAALELQGGTAVDPARTMELRHRMDALVEQARAAGRLEEIQVLLHDAHLDLGYLASGGVAPTSVRLAHQRPR
jgi:hypothetical protein